MQRSFRSLDLQTTCTAAYRDFSCRSELAWLGKEERLIARGAGVSYVAASFGPGSRSIGMHGCDRILSFDPERRLITVEAGTSLGALYDFLLPYRFYLPIQPGHPQISIGGCIACNVHGKNPQRDGLFAEQVESLELFHPDRGVLVLSREQNREVFELTCGGFGLTGIILSATLRLTVLPAAIVEVTKVRVRSVEDACERVEALKAQQDFLYTWNDLSTFGKEMGRGYVCCGRFTSDAGSGRSLPRYRSISTQSAGGWPPKVLPALIPWLTRVHFYREMTSPVRRVNLCDVLYPGMYGGRYYFDAYGRQGFFGHMVLVPNDRWRLYVRRLEGLLRQHRQPIIALAIKAFAGEQRLLHFNGTGFSMHSHIANTESGRALLLQLEALSDELDMIRTIYFDSRLTAEKARQMYPQYDSFKQRLHQFDPQRRFESALSRRLDL